MDRFGARRLALIGLAVFAVGAGAGAVVSSIGALIATRVVQGAGAGLLVSPAALAGAVSGFPPERRGSALGIWGASAGMSNLLGPLLGGPADGGLLGWRANWWALRAACADRRGRDRPVCARRWSTARRAGPGPAATR